MGTRTIEYHDSVAPLSLDAGCEMRGAGHDE
jgi:hypothetical protein